LSMKCGITDTVDYRALSYETAGVGEVRSVQEQLPDALCFRRYVA
jgi:hypothetical protein